MKVSGVGTANMVTKVDSAMEGVCKVAPVLTKKPNWDVREAPKEPEAYVRMDAMGPGSGGYVMETVAVSDWMAATDMEKSLASLDAEEPVLTGPTLGGVHRNWEPVEKIGAKSLVASRWEDSAPDL